MSVEVGPASGQGLSSLVASAGRSALARLAQAMPVPARVVPSAPKETLDVPTSDGIVYGGPVGSGGNLEAAARSVQVNWEGEPRVRHLHF